MKDRSQVKEFVLSRGDPLSLLSHMTFYGLASILESEGQSGVLLSWTDGMAPRPRLSGPYLTEQVLARSVLSHAEVRSRSDSWPSERIAIQSKTGSTQRGLMSPRLGAISDWPDLQSRRHRVLNELMESRRWVDSRLLWSLGEPSYWRFGKDGKLARQDEGASRLEMQPRNQGSEIVGNRFSPLADLVKKRTESDVISGLRGEVVLDKLGNDKPSSRSATGFRGPGPVDDVVSWCALWGISQFALSQSTRETAATLGHLSSRSKDLNASWFYVPVWRGEWTPSRLRSLLAGSQLRQAAAEAVGLGRGTVLEPTERWLQVRDVLAVITFRIEILGGKSPESRAQRGTLHRIGLAP